MAMIAATVFSAYRYAIHVYPLYIYTRYRYNDSVIKTFGDHETEKIFNQVISKAFSRDMQKIALRKLIMLDNALSMDDLRIPPSNHLEKLKGDRKNRYSIRENKQYRICFRIVNNDYYDVTIVDYH